MKSTGEMRSGVEKVQKGQQMTAEERRKSMRMENETAGKGRCRRCVDSTGKSQSVSQ